MSDLEQLADETIRLRAEFVAVVDSLPNSIRDEHRILRLAWWADANPALDALAVDRETALGRLYETGVTPDPGCMVRAILVQIAATQDPKLPHRYWVGRDGVRIGWAWLSTRSESAGIGRYVVLAGGVTTYGDRLEEALHRAAQVIDGFERAARTGAVQ